MEYKYEEYQKKTVSNMQHVLIYKVSNQNSELCYSHTLNVVYWNDDSIRFALLYEWIL